MHDRNNRYNALSIGTHWLTVLLLLAVYALMEFHDIFPKGSDARDLMKTWHFMLGLTVFCLVFARLMLRLVFRAPPITPPPPAWQHQAAGVMHVALYGFLVVMPLLGWVVLSAKGQVIPFFEWQWPALMSPDKSLARSLEDVHGLLGTIGYFLIGLHAAAALYHHYLVRDDTLTRMWPGRR